MVNRVHPIASWSIKKKPFLGETKALGCGLVIYSREAWQNLKLFCYYDSPNVGLASDPLYEVGPPCSSCQPGFSCDVGLCASSDAEVTTTERGSTERGSTESGITERGSTEGQSTDVSRQTGTGSTLDWENYAM